jgi:hypothetical protein
MHLKDKQNTMRQTIVYGDKTGKFPQTIEKTREGKI